MKGGRKNISAKKRKSADANDHTLAANIFNVLRTSKQGRSNLVLSNIIHGVAHASQSCENL